MNLYIFTHGCDFKYEMSEIDEHTTKATIVIKHITSECAQITCSVGYFQKSKTVGKEIIHTCSVIC